MTEKAVATRYCFEGDFTAPTASGRLIRELLMAARSLEMPLAVQLRRSYLNQKDPGLPEFISTLAKRPASGHVRVVCLPAFALPEKVEHGIFWAISGFDPVHPTPCEILKLKAADRVWAVSPAHFATAKGKLKSTEKLKLFPLAVNPKLFHPGASWPEKVDQSKKFRFLIVGNPLFRKGIDIALEAYLREFKAKEPVELVLKLTHMPKLKKQFSYEISDLGKRLGAINDLFPSVRVVAETLPDKELAGLMAGCQVFLSTNRSYHTALIVREAMASGLPVIGPTLLKDLAGIPENLLYSLPTVTGTVAPEVLFAGSPQTRVDPIDVKALQRQMREAFTKPSVAREKGIEGLKISKGWPSWQQLAVNLRDAFKG